MALIKCPECGKEVSDKAATCPSCGTTIKKKRSTIKIILGVLILLGIIGAFAGSNDSGDKSGNKPVAADSQKAPQEEMSLTVMTPAQLWKEFDDNEVAANSKYQGKQVAIEGTIYAIESSVMGYPEIVFNVSYGIETVRCQFSKDHLDQIANMKKGQKVLVVGKVETFVLGSVLSLGKCYFAEKIKE